MQPILEAKNISVCFNTTKGIVYAVNEVDLVLNKGEVLGIVGESGSGKTQLMHSLINLLPENAVLSGQVIYAGQNILAASTAQINTIRSNDIAMIFQDPMSCLNPYLKISTQLTEAMLISGSLSKSDAMQQAIAMLEKVQIPDAARRIYSYPYQLSGGMRQRVMLAMALLRNPKILIADEPTTALDVTVQAEILQLLKQLTAEYGLSVLFITHDLSIVAGQCDRVMVMYAGNVVEKASVDNLFYQPGHPYTQGLLASAKSQSGMSDKLVSITGQAPVNNKRQTGCPFYARCNQRIDPCEQNKPVLRGNGSKSQACHLYA
ncbi:ABC transporter, ATP-binding protein (cluster 5, nickel/peptides/opines) / ABC transporter, ATP-binding protein (cluster 5, nickel/peptides/opines) [hydrothermal vent metagenome]|uniref:ABC transporter, ATP-binding protein (Cluster 5, nickel/peptides/opines) / ABC transporter, ATP-binding protein (Cluster 5, nickel/peptides/opines) n=1 Tax=hydrothermal vent metagenome TaxID=652676 RepID=A0A3B1AI90_9ZZZZ